MAGKPANYVKVTFATDQTTTDGVNHKAGSEGTIDPGEARVLASRGLARVETNPQPARKRASGRRRPKAAATAAETTPVAAEATDNEE